MYEYYANPKYPCTYCVQWEEINDEEAIPMLPDGPVQRLYAAIHPECARRVAEYSSQENDA
jgi:hypothetical protein